MKHLIYLFVLFIALSVVMANNCYEQPYATSCSDYCENLSENLGSEISSLSGWDDCKANQKCCVVFSPIDSGEEFVNLELRTCKSLNGSICEFEEKCNGKNVLSSDGGSKCCLGECKNLTNTCLALGGEECLFNEMCKGGSMRVTTDSMRCCLSGKCVGALKFKTVSTKCLDDLKGTKCSINETCDGGSILVAEDSGLCCVGGKCKLIESKATKPKKERPMGLYLFLGAVVIIILLLLALKISKMFK